MPKKRVIQVSKSYLKAQADGIPMYIGRNYFPCLKRAIEEAETMREGELREVECE